MEQSDFDAAGFVQFDLENGSISCAKDQPLALVPLDVLTALDPGDRLHDAAKQFGRRQGELLVETFPEPGTPVSVDALASYLGGTAATLGMGRLGLEIHGDALTFRIQMNAEVAASKGYQTFLCGFLAGYLGALTNNDFDVVPLEAVNGEQWYFAGNPHAVAQVRIWVGQGKEPLEAINQLGGRSA